MKYDFDKPVIRRGTASVKWDSTEEPDVIPLWVADMDFRTAPCVIDALKRRVEHGVFGYVRVPDAYYEALTSWFERRHSWKIERNSVIYVPGVVPAVSAAIKALTQPGDGVILQTPAYNCFFSSIRNNGCELVENPLRRVDSEDSFTYEFDFDDLEEKVRDPRNKVMILCNPHNPSGRVWTREELSRVKEICGKYGVRVLCDEIHCELEMPGYHYIPYRTIDSEAVAFCSPSKAFNTAGLQIANIVTPNEEVRRLIDRAVNDNEVCDVNPFGVVGLIAAYNEGEDWLLQLNEYIHQNYEFLKDWFGRNLPALKVGKLEATYLAWVDIHSLGVGSMEFEEKALSEGRVWVNAGEMYGLEGYIRINMACPRAQLQEGLERLKGVIEGMSK